VTYRNQTEGFGEIEQLLYESKKHEFENKSPLTKKENPQESENVDPTEYIIDHSDLNGIIEDKKIREEIYSKKDLYETYLERVVLTPPKGGEALDRIVKESEASKKILEKGIPRNHRLYEKLKLEIIGLLMEQKEVRLSQIQKNNNIDKDTPQYEDLLSAVALIETIIAGSENTGPIRGKERVRNTGEEE
jgi:hypothetical protein